MANNAISMQKTRQVLRLRSQGKGIKAISSLVSIARNTVKKYLSRLEESGVDLDSALSLSDMDLQALLQEKPVVPISTRHEILYGLLPIYCKRLKRTTAGYLPPRIVKQFYLLAIGETVIGDGLAKLSKEVDSNSVILARKICEMVRLTKVRKGAMAATA